MKIEIIAIGSELLLGSGVNTNAAFICRSLSAIGLIPSKQTVLPDSHAEIVAGLAQAIRENDLVICTGGLGPTRDDITRNALSATLGCELVRSDEVARHLQARYGDKLATLEDQALIPSLSKPILNDVGTAPGLLVQVQEAILVSLPGVPVEMEAMIQGAVIPFLKSHFQGKRLATVEAHFFQVAESRVDSEARSVLKDDPEIDYGIYPRLGQLTVRLSSTTLSPAELQTKANQIAAPFTTNTFPSESATLEEAIHARLLKMGLTLSLAESCTGGALAARFTHLAGASKYFLGSAVAYSNKLKEKILGVSKNSLDSQGAVSALVVEAMVRGLVALTDSDLALAVSGIAGPSGGTREKPVGTIFFAALRRGGAPIISQIHAPGNRDAVIIRAVNHSLGEIWKLV